ncbi:MAG: NAD-dependent epimerase/dehydratase family protein [Bacteroidota bacterium]
MQTLLGAGGSVGNELAKALKTHTDRIRLVSRNPQKVHPEDEVFKADLTKTEEVMEAVKGSKIVYLIVGYPYSVKVWAEMWPITMEHVIKACLAHKAKLVFFDNIYMYDPRHLAPMNEETPHNPSSEKGKIRKRIVDRLWKAVREEGLEALIARSADFYGPGLERNGVLRDTVITPLSKGKKANWMKSLDYKHSYTYVPDAAKATALLGNTPDAYGESWHLPTASQPLTGKEWVELIAKEFGVKARVRVISDFMLKLIGIFVPVMRELPEMNYQYDRDYIFDSSKFELEFSMKPTPYREGIRRIIKEDFSG